VLPSPPWQPLTTRGKTAEPKTYEYLSHLLRQQYCRLLWRFLQRSHAIKALTITAGLEGNHFIAICLYSTELRCAMLNEPEYGGGVIEPCKAHLGVAMEVACLMEL